MLKLYTVGFGILLLSGCASYGVIDNKPLTEPPPTRASSTDSYSIENMHRREDTGDITMTLNFSGGGTRASALSYGVMEELRDTTVVIDGQTRRLLDEVDTISSVSGGSFTSAYYGLYGERMLEDYKDAFLTVDIEHKLVRGLFNPLRWFSTKGRTEMAVELYDKHVFHDATFTDMQRAGGPLIMINASDLGYGVRFTFVQEYFNLLCSDINSFPVSRAVTASSAVPIVFHPIVVENYRDCKTGGKPEWMTAAAKRLAGDPELSQVLKGLESYYEDDKRQYAHFVDGGITDNLGLRATYEVVGITGGATAYYERYKRKIPQHIALISVDASTDPEPEMDYSNKQPSLPEAISAMSNVQLHRYNDATLEAIHNKLGGWAEAVSTPERPVTPHFIQLDFGAINQPEELAYLNSIPTSFDLSDEQVDKLIATGRELLRNNPDFQRLLAALGGAHDQVSPPPAMH